MTSHSCSLEEDVLLREWDGVTPGVRQLLKAIESYDLLEDDNAA